MGSLQMNNLNGLDMRWITEKAIERRGQLMKNLNGLHMRRIIQKAVKEACFIEDLLNEVLEIIIYFSLTVSPRNIVDTFNILSMISKQFRNPTGSFIERLPQLFFDRDACVGYHSMQQLYKTCGKASGLVLALKALIAHP